MNDRSIVETSSPYGNDVHFPLNEYETTPNTPLIDTAWIRGALFRQRWLIVTPTQIFHILAARAAIKRCEYQELLSMTHILRDSS